MATLLALPYEFFHKQGFRLMIVVLRYIYSPDS